MNIERRVPLIRFIDPVSFRVGTETTEVIDFFTKSGRYVFKMVEPLAFHVPRKIDDEIRAIKDKKQRALFVAEYKKRQYELLKQALGEHIAPTHYFVFEEENRIYVGILQNKINGPTLRSLEINYELPDEYLTAYGLFETTVYAASLSKYIETSQLELFFSGNLIFEPDKQIVIAVDW